MENTPTDLHITNEKNIEPSVSEKKEHTLGNIKSIMLKTSLIGGASLLSLTSCIQEPTHPQTPMPTSVGITQRVETPTAIETETLLPSPTIPPFNEDIEIPTNEPEDMEVNEQDVTITINQYGKNKVDLTETTTPNPTPISDKTEEVYNNIEQEKEPNIIIHKEWTDEIKQVEIVDGKANFEAYLFVDKGSDDNHDRLYTKKGESALIWNATEAAYRFGEVNMSPGDEISFTQTIGFGQIIPQNRQYYENIEHGEGYVKNGEGACFAATVLGEGLGLSVLNNQGKKVPIFVTEEGAIHGHEFEYSNLYRGPGIGINSSEYGQFFFSLNPELPESVKVTIKMGVVDTEPNKHFEGFFTPVLSISIEGLPDEYKTLESMRMTSHRKEVLKMISGREW